MPRRVMASIRRTSPLARARPGSPASRWWSLARQMIRSPAEASAPSAIRIVRPASTRPRWIRSSRMRGGQFPAAGPVRGHQQDVASGQVGGDVGAGGLVGGVVGRGAADAAVLVVLIQSRGVPLAEAEGGGAFPGGGEPDRFGELDIAEPVRQEHHGAAAFDGGQLFLISGKDQLAPVAGDVLGDGGEVGDGDHGGLVGQDQRAGRDLAALDGAEQPGGVHGDPNASLAQAVGGVLGGGGADYRPVPRPGEGGQDAGLAGACRAGYHFDSASRGERVPGCGRLVQPQPARRVMFARVARAAGQCRAELREVGAETPTRPARRARAARRAPARARPAAPPSTVARRWRTARRPAACRCCARPVRGAARRAAAATPAPPGTPPRRSGQTAPPRPGPAATLGLLPGSFAGILQAGRVRAV